MLRVSGGGDDDVDGAEGMSEAKILVSESIKPSAGPLDSRY